MKIDKVFKPVWKQQGEKYEIITFEEENIKDIMKKAKEKKAIEAKEAKIHKIILANRNRKYNKNIHRKK